MDPIIPPLPVDETATTSRTSTSTAGSTGGSTAGMDAAEIDSDRRIREAKSHLAERLQELERRLEGFKEQIDPRAWVANPWARFGIAFGVGYLLGRTNILRPIFGAAFTATASAVVKELVGRQIHQGG